MSAFRKGSRENRIYDILLEHQYTRTDTIRNKVDFTDNNVAACLTKLRRKGLASYRGTSIDPGGRQWRRYPLSSPLFPPQEDIQKRNGRKQVPKVATSRELRDRITRDLNMLVWIIKRQEKELEAFQEIKAKIGELG